MRAKDETVSELETAISMARERMIHSLEKGDTEKARQEQEYMRDLIAERAPARVASMEKSMGLRVGKEMAHVK